MDVSQNQNSNGQTAKNKKVVLGVSFFVYIIGYSFFRVEHLLVHVCHHVGGRKHYDGVRLLYPDTTEILFLNWWEVVFFIFIDIIYTPLMVLEAFLHSHNLLPSSCPW